MVVQVEAGFEKDLDSLSPQDILIQHKLNLMLLHGAQVRRNLVVKACKILH